MYSSSQIVTFSLSQQRNVKLNQFNAILNCLVCNGYYRFAHTISDCGHTFCFICVSQKSNCPKCGIQFNKSNLRKDPFIQNIIDTIFPQFQSDDELVLQRLKIIFGDCLDDRIVKSLLEEKDHTIKKKKKLNKYSDKTDLALLVSTTFNDKISLEQFKIGIYDEQSFQGYMNLYNQINVQKKELDANIKHTLTLKGLTTKDYNIAKITYKITFNEKDNKQEMPLFKRLRRLILKSIKIDECVSLKLIDPQLANLDNIKLYYQNVELQDNHPLTVFSETQNKNIIVYYDIQFKI